MKVFYSPKQNTTANVSKSPVDGKPGSPSAGKPALLVEYWQQQNLPIQFVSDFAPASREQLSRAHQREYVDGILECRIANGFDNTIAEVADTLPWTNGSFMAAAVDAWQNKTATMSPTSGFHHASHDKPLGFCTFNGLMVAALELIHLGVEKIGILDLDHHYGNGTDGIIHWLQSLEEIANQTPTGVVYPKQSIAEKFHHYTFGSDAPAYTNAHYDWKGGEQAKAWLDHLPTIVESFAFVGCEIVLFQAGADPHVDDPYGGALTSQQLAKRDEIVFSKLKQLGIPVAWNLAGGYQEPIQKVLDIHTATLRACLKHYLAE